MVGFLSCKLTTSGFPLLMRSSSSSAVMQFMESIPGLLRLLFVASFLAYPALLQRTCDCVRTSARCRIELSVPERSSVGFELLLLV